MPRRGNVAKREVLADPIYNSKVVTRLVNYIMLDGKKGVAQEIVYDAFDIVKEKTGNDPLEMFEKAMENIMPNLECKTRRVGGANYQVPLEVSPARVRPWVCVGSPLTAAPVARRPCLLVWLLRSSTPPTVSAALSRSARIRTRWPRPTRLLPTIVIDSLSRRYKPWLRREMYLCK